MYTPALLSPGQVILCEAPRHEAFWDRWLDDAISWSSGPFDHAALVGNGELIEQLSPVVVSPLEKYAANGWVYTIPSLTAEEAQGMIAWARARLGMTYGFRAILEDGAMLDLKDWNLLRITPTYPTCSGFVERAARLGGGVALTEMPLPTPTALAFSPRLQGARPWEKTEANPAL